MRVFSWDEITSPDFDSRCFESGTALSIGSFDGPHLGHRMLFDTLSNAAAKKNIKSCVVTFPLPLPALKYPNDYIGNISTLRQRLFEFERLGIDFCVVAEFSEKLRRMDGNTFLLALMEKLNMRFIAEGREFHFGRNGISTIKDISAFCNENGIECAFPDFVYYEGKRISSSSIREKIKDGFLDNAAHPLGREFELDLSDIEGKGNCNADGQGGDGEMIYERRKISQVLPRSGTFLIRVNGKRKKVVISEKNIVIRNI